MQSLEHGLPLMASGSDPSNVRQKMDLRQNQKADVVLKQEVCVLKVPDHTTWRSERTGSLHERVDSLHKRVDSLHDCVDNALTSGMNV